MATTSATDLITPAEPKPGVLVSAAAIGSSTGTSSVLQANSQLLNLPLDVLALIFETCDWPSAVALRRTCRQFRYAFPVVRTIQKATHYRQILADADDGTFPAPCYGCLRVLPMNRFSSTWPGIEGESLGRRCTGCALASELLPPGAKYELKGIAMVLCKGCKKHRREEGRWAPENPSGYCPRCRRFRGLLKWLGGRQHSTSFWAVMTCLTILALVALTLRSIVTLWRMLPYDDRAVQDFALFTAIYQSIVQLSWLATFGFARYMPRQNRWRQKAFRAVTGNAIVAEMFVEFCLLLVSCCMPFTMGYVASARAISWATITWCVASFGAIMRMIAEDDLKPR